MDRLTEYTKVEQPLIEQLQVMGWDYLRGDEDVPYLTERESFQEVLLRDRLRAAVRRLNLDDAGRPWLDDTRVNQAVSALERIGAPRLMEANLAATDQLLRGVVVPGDPALHGGRDQTVRFIDFERPERNEFLAINQFRVDPPWATGGRGHVVPDVVLFVNGIPLVVIECKSPGITDPMEEGIKQLLRYANLREEMSEPEGAERLFHYNQIMVATHYYGARFGTISASYAHYLEWKDTSPVPTAQVAAELGKDRLESQETLVAGMLRPAHLLDLVRNFTVFDNRDGRTVKIVGRYQQFRAVHAAIGRLLHGKTRAQDGEFDQRGGVIWHTQGAGKSLTMVFLVRKMRTIPELRRFKAVIVTDRRDLERQLGDTAALTGETVRKAESIPDLRDVLREEGPGLVFAMIQKYQDRDLDRDEWGVVEPFPVLNPSEDILVMVDEAHRSHASALHANLLAALPNSARIGFTGTPILIGARKKTHEIFGPFLDQYTIRQSEDDRVTVPIVYEGRTADAVVADGRTLDALFEDMFHDRTPEEREAIKAKYATEGDVLEAEKLIAAKAEDMLRHYVEVVLPNRFKAQVVAVSRRAAVRYQAALAAAHRPLLADLEALDPALLSLTEEQLQAYDRRTQFLVRAHAQLDLIRRLEFAAVISGDHNDPPELKAWSNPVDIENRIAAFKMPLVHEDPAKASGLAFLCVKSMLLTGFDAPVEQALYLDRKMQGHELLQAIARVNRTASGKSRGLVVDYYGVTRHLEEALAVYSAEDVQGALASIKDALPILADRHRRVLAIFRDRGIEDIADVDECVFLLRDAKLRAEFVAKLKLFLESVDLVMPRPEALPYLHDARVLGFINKAAANRYRDAQLNLMGVGRKVRQLIDRYIVTEGIDPTVPPISILDADFAAVVDAQVSDRAKALEMEHAIRHHISQRFPEDPVYYRKLSERLEEILRRLQGNWAELAEALRAYTEEVQRGRPADETSLDPHTQAPFLSLLVDAAGDPNRLHELAGLTIEMVDHIRQEVRLVDFWRNVHARTQLRSWVIGFLDEHDVVPFDRQETLADRIVDLAKHRHVELLA